MARLDGEGRPFITLAQFLKVHQVVGSGGAGKVLVREGGITVNGEPEVRPGRKLHAGDVVRADGRELKVTMDDDGRVSGG